jgi:hypothetical protein
MLQVSKLEPKHPVYNLYKLLGNPANILVEIHSLGNHKKNIKKEGRTLWLV